MHLKNSVLEFPYSQYSLILQEICGSYNTEHSKTHARQTGCGNTDVSDTACWCFGLFLCTDTSIKGKCF